LDELKTDEKYQAKDDEEKQSYLTKKKNALKKSVMREYKK
jgi:hypothetical protein